MHAPDTTRSGQAWPVVENFMPDFKLPSAEGQPIKTSDYHSHDHDPNRRSLILVFVGPYSSDMRGPTSGLLSDLSRRYAEIVSGSAEVLAIVRGTTAEAAQVKQDGRLPFPVLADEDGQVYRDYGAITPDGRSVSQAVYVAGRYGKVYLSSRASDGPPLPTADGVLGSLDFIESRCPECGREEF